MNNTASHRKLARGLILGASLLVVGAAVALIAAIHVYGNHSIGEDGSPFQFWTGIGTTLVTCLSTLLLGVIVCNCGTLLGDQFKSMRGKMVALLVLCELFTLLWLRSGLEHAMASRDVTGQAQAQEVAWNDVENSLKGNVAAARIEGEDITKTRAAMEDTRRQIDEAMATANDMDNDGNGANDKLIPGMLAKAESLKANLANLSSELDAALARHAATVDKAVAALVAHQQTRGQVLGGIAAAQAEQHQFVRWAEELRALFPGLKPEWALQLVLTGIALLLMVPQYAGLAGISAALRIEIPQEQANVAAPPAAIEPQAEQTEMDLQFEPDPSNVITGTFTMPTRRTDLKAMLRVARNVGVPLPVARSSDFDRMDVNELRHLAATAMSHGKLQELFGSRRTA